MNERPNEKRIAIIVFALGVLVLAASVIVGSRVSTSATQPTRLDSGTRTCVTNAQSYCVVTHNLGVVPNAVVATPRAPISGGKIAGALAADSFTATTFRVRIFQPSGAGYASASATFSYVATTDVVTPPPTSDPPTTTPTPPPTTTTPPPTGFPTADDTGGEVPSCAAPKTTVADFESRGAGDVIENMIINGELNVTDPNVVVRCTVVRRANGNSFPWIVAQRSGNLTLDRVTVSGVAGQLSVGGIRQISGSGLTLDHVKIVLTQDACSPCGSGLSMHDSFVQLAPTFCDPGGGPDPCQHNDGIQTSGGSVQIIHNRVVNPNSQNSTIALLTESGSMTNSLIQDNLLDEGREIQAFAGCSTDGHPPTNVVWDGNTFVRHDPTWDDPFHSRCAGVTLTGNHWDDGTPIT